MDLWVCYASEFQPAAIVRTAQKCALLESWQHPALEAHF
jgi:adenylate cyclase